MKYDFITIGGITEDFFIYTHEGVVINNKKDPLKQRLLGFEYGAKILVDQAENFFGGGAANAAVAFARLGFNTAALLAVGSDLRGQAALKDLKQNKVSLKSIQKIKNQLTGYSAVIVAGDKEHVAFPVRGANHFLRINLKQNKELKQTDWVYLTSLSGEWQTNLEELFKIVPQVKIAWNPGHIQLSAGLKVLKKFLALTSVLIVNVDEARELLLSDLKQTKISADDLKKTEMLAKALAQLGPEMVVVTDSSKGAVVWADNHKHTFKPEKINNTLNTVGVGDAFGSSFIAGLKLYNNIDLALKLAGRNAARVVRSHGAQIGLLYKTQI
jgi:sugar/nucleoside kinase (ribokinase family)